MTNVFSVVVTTLVAGNKSDGRDCRTGHITVGYMPEANAPFGFITSISTAIARVLASTEWEALETTPVNVCPGYAGTVNGTLDPLTIPPTSLSGTATTKRSRVVCSSWNIADVPVPGPTRAPG